MREVARHHRARPLLFALSGAAVLAAACQSVSAQCAMCRAAVGSSAEAAAAANGMNLAVLVLLIPPVALFCAMFVVAYRYRKAPDEALPGDFQEQSIRQRINLKEGEQDARGGGRRRRRRSRRGDHDGPTAIAEAT